MNILSKILLTAFLFYSNHALCNLENDSKDIVRSISKLVFDSEKMLKEIIKYNDTAVTGKAALALRDTYHTMSAEGVLPMPHGRGGTVFPDIASISSGASAMPNLNMGFHYLTPQIHELYQKFENIISRIKSLHSKYTMTYRLWICLRYYVQHPGTTLSQAAAANMFSRSEPPRQELILFIHLLGELINALASYCSLDEKIMLDALKIIRTITNNEQYSFFEFSNFDA